MAATSPFSDRAENAPANNLDLEKASIYTIEEKIQNNDYNESQQQQHALEKDPSGIDEASIVEPLPDNILNDIPDGGYGWAIVVAGFFGNFIMFGIASIWGLFSQAYATSVLEGKASTLALMTVGSVTNVCLNVLSPVSILTARFGTRFNYALGSVLMVLGVILTGFSYEIWHIYLTQGVLYGFGCAFVYMSIASVIPQWFSKKRAFAMGICASGTGLGGLCLSPLSNYLIQKYGIGWAYHILGFFALGVAAVGTILIKDRLPRSYRIKQQQKMKKSPIDFSMFKVFNFNIWLIGAVISLMGYLAPLFYIPKYAAEIGINEYDSSNLLSVLLAMSAIGRIGLGLLADYIGRLNMFIIGSALSGIFSFVIWPFASSYSILLVYCILWGMTCGLYYALAAPITASVVGLEKLSSGLSILFIFSAISAMGTPISSAIQEATPNNGYIGIQMFVGAVYVLGSIICIILKYRLTGSLLSKY